MSTLMKVSNLIYNTSNKNILTIPHLSIRQGEVVGIMGPNGAGKSTMLKLLSLLESPSEGCIFYREKEIQGDSIPISLRRKFAIALQQSLLLDTSVFQNVALGLKLRNQPKTYIQERVEYWLEAFRIGHLAKKQASQLSGGEAQRVNLARAMILDPEVLFLDEPFSALDFPTKIQLLKDFKNVLGSTQTTTLFISHDIMEIKYLTESLIILMEGEIKQSGNTKDVLAAPNQFTKPFLQDWDLLTSLTSPTY